MGRGRAWIAGGALAAIVVVACRADSVSNASGIDLPPRPVEAGTSPSEGLVGADASDASSDAGCEGGCSRPVTYSLVTSTHRYDSDKMWSGWGSHLGHLLGAADGSLYFVDDTGNDVNVNPAAAYYRFAAGAWTRVATVPFIGTIQQNTGSVLAKSGIAYTYGIDIANSVVEECTFDTSHLIGECHSTAMATGANANYVGAAISPSGYRVVWWTTTDGSFRYIYNFGGGWNGPVVSGINGYEDFSYASASFSDDNHFHLSGEGVTGTAPNWTFTALYTNAVIGSVITGWTVLPGTTKSGPLFNTSATWVDTSGAVHMIAHGASGDDVYIHRSATGAFTTSDCTPAGVSTGRLISSADGNLYYVAGAPGGGGILFQSIPKSQITGPVPWYVQPVHSVPAPSGVTGYLLLFPELAQYQEAPVLGLHVVANDYTNLPGSLYYANLTE
jgi:hypothetical protein